MLHLLVSEKNASRPGQFVIKWIPNMLPLSKYGGMRMKLQYGHIKNDTEL